MVYPSLSISVYLLLPLLHFLIALIHDHADFMKVEKQADCKSSILLIGGGVSGCFKTADFVVYYSWQHRLKKVSSDVLTVHPLFCFFVESFVWAYEFIQIGDVDADLPKSGLRFLCR